MKTVIRIVIGLLGLLALAATVNFWLRPELAAQGVGLTVANPMGLASVRADIAGFFAVSGLFALLTAWTGRAEYALTTLALMSAALLGRAINIVLGSFDQTMLVPMVIEAVTIVIFLFGYRTLKAN
jgi:hypothetical protein